jgi:two-component system CheB/CheR fusion protein
LRAGAYVLGVREDAVQLRPKLFWMTRVHLRAGIRACLSGDGDHTEQVVPATNRRGRAITCRVAATPLNGVNKEIRGVILLMDEQAAGASPVH